MTAACEPSVVPPAAPSSKGRSLAGCKAIGAGRCGRAACADRAFWHTAVHRARRTRIYHALDLAAYVCCSACLAGAAARVEGACDPDTDRKATEVCVCNDNAAVFVGVAIATANLRGATTPTTTSPPCRDGRGDQTQDRDHRRSKGANQGHSGDPMGQPCPHGADPVGLRLGQARGGRQEVSGWDSGQDATQCGLPCAGRIRCNSLWPRGLW